MGDFGVAMAIDTAFEANGECVSGVVWVLSAGVGYIDGVCVAGGALE